MRDAEKCVMITQNPHCCSEKLLFLMKLNIKNTFILLILALLFCNCQSKAQNNTPPAEWSFHFQDTMYIHIDSTEHFYIFSPKYKSIDLACGTRPDTLDHSVVMCLPAAFTGKILDTFFHENIAGNHVSDGIYFKGYECPQNMMGFVYFADGSWQMLPSADYNSLIFFRKDVVCAFEQAAVVRCDTIFEPRLYKNLDKTEYFRSLCEMPDGQLRVVMTKGKVRFGDYRQWLCDELKVHNSIYMDMGPGWNYSWYLGDNNQHHEIFPIKRFTKNQTNWLIFKQ